MSLYQFIIIFFTVATTKFLCISAKADSDLLDEIVETVNNYADYELPKDNKAFFLTEDNLDHLIDFGTYDFIIIGGGTAGGVLANRLTEERFTVLVIEAGKEDPPVSSVVGLFPYLLKSDWNWGYQTVPQVNSCLANINHSCNYPRGKSLGGSSVINGGIYVRGNAKDYDAWAEMGNSGWSYKDCLPYFKKSERAEFHNNIDKKYHGFHGPQTINIIEDIPNLTTVILKAFKEFGLEELDYNGQYQHGVSKMQNYLDYNIRADTAHAFIRPAACRNNLKITLESLVTKITISNKIAYGVQFVKKGMKYFAKARKEVILSAGAINSPQVLMLSGIGPAEELRKHDINIIADLPVGKYLSDHICFFPLTYRTNYVYFNNTISENYELWKNGKPPLMGMVTIGSFLSFEVDEKKKRSSQPETSMYIATAPSRLATLFRLNDDYSQAFQVLNDLTDFAVFVTLFHPKSYGKVTLQSNNPRDFPLIDTNYFSDDRDIEKMYKAIQIALTLNNTEAFRQRRIKLYLIPFPSCDLKFERMSKEWWFCGLRNLVTSLYHPIATTRMGINPINSVVDPELKVHGIKNLRVVDAGVIPSSTSGHTNAPVVMIAEKIADAIKAEHLFI